MAMSKGPILYLGFRPRTSLQFFALEHSVYKAKHCRDVLGRKARYKTPP